MILADNSTHALPYLSQARRYWRRHRPCTLPQVRTSAAAARGWLGQKKVRADDDHDDDDDDDDDDDADDDDQDADGELASPPQTTTMMLMLLVASSSNDARC